MGGPSERAAARKSPFTAGIADMFGSPRAVSRDLRAVARPVADLLELMRDARLALVGEAGHGTHVLPAASARAVARRLCARAHRW
ncbi:MAG: hypothetical protein QOD81_291 [Solirubrobacteraceae bacterium]|nr:hypothetical protein [Solirubrobacteraceae bacterium]